jgi:riboflavin biosynthesis pyrimidine reductase
LPDTIHTLIDRCELPEPSVLPEELRSAYGGDLAFPPPGSLGPYVVGNFVSTVDGVVSYQVAGKSGGGVISGFDEPDRFIMGLLRASADAVMVGSGTLHQTTPDHLFVAGSVYPEAGNLYARYRSETLKKMASPLHVVVSGSGRLDLTRALFRIRTLIVTTPAGRYLLVASGVESLVSTQVRCFEGPAIRAASILQLLRAEFGVSLLLHEGGPTLFGAFVAEGCIDELFLTIAPQMAGRNRLPLRPGLIANLEFLPETAPWFQLVSVKERRNYLYLRYRADSEASRPAALLA